MKAKITIWLKEGVHDPQGEAVCKALGHLGFSEVVSARVGKMIELELNDSKPDAALSVKAMCEKLLANTIIESYAFEFVE